jgi:EmrB/QacA subfamily drug resistance transporter
MRCLQGLGAAIVLPAALSIVMNMFPEGAERNKALGVWGAIGASGATVGVMAGGLLTRYVGWQYIFFLNVPIGAAALLLAPRIVPESRLDTARRRYDPFGAVTVTGGLSLLVYAIVNAEKAGWGSTETIVLLAIAAALIAAFVAIERRSPAPLVPFRIFRLPTLTGANAVGLLIGAALFSMFFFASLYMQQVLGYGAIKAGISYLPLSAGIIISAAFSSQLSTRIGFKPVLVAGCVLMAIALVWWSQISPDGSYVSDILGPSVVAAIGLGLGFVAITIAAVAGVSEHESGLASGLINTSQQVGGALGLAILATIANSVTDDKLAGATTPAEQGAALTDGFQQAFLAGAGFAVLALILCLTLIRTSDSRAMVDREAAERVGA